METENQREVGKWQGLGEGVKGGEGGGSREEGAGRDLLRLVVRGLSFWGTQMGQTEKGPLGLCDANFWKLLEGWAPPCPVQLCCVALVASCQAFLLTHLVGLASLNGEPPPLKNASSCGGGVISQGSIIFLQPVLSL